MYNIIYYIHAYSHVKDSKFKIITSKLNELSFLAKHMFQKRLENNVVGYYNIFLVIENKIFTKGVLMLTSHYYIDKPVMYII